MSRKGKKRAKGKYRQPMRPAGPLSAAGTPGAQTTPTRSVSQARVGGDQALVRAVELSLEKYCSVVASLAPDIPVTYDVTLR